MKADLRVQKTKQMLYRALVEEMEACPFNEIRIVSVVRRAGVTKNTFYRHYDTLYDLYYEMMAEEVERINGALYDPVGGYGGKEQAVRHVECLLENQRVWRVALKETSPNILIDLLVRHFERTAQEFYDGRPDLSCENPVTDGDLSLYRRFGCATEVMTFRYIIDHADWPPEKLAEKINENFVAFGESAVGSDYRKRGKRKEKGL